MDAILTDFDAACDREHRTGSQGSARVIHRSHGIATHRFNRGRSTNLRYGAASNPRAIVMVPAWSGRIRDAIWVSWHQSQPSPPSAVPGPSPAQRLLRLDGPDRLGQSLRRGSPQRLLSLARPRLAPTPTWATQTSALSATSAVNIPRNHPHSRLPAHVVVVHHVMLQRVHRDVGEAGFGEHLQRQFLAPARAQTAAAVG